jgi:nitroimidazol reductase NimA-like FMN-containing flavoprotein (pyridoxamine 5'-phosphate oxidase superfamily)
MSERRSGAKPTPAPRISEMTPDACHALLKRHHVGRMAYCLHNHVDIAPIHYVYSDGWLFARTSHGHKMDALAHAPWVAFEVDEIDDVFDWRSVVVHGTAHTMEREGSPLDVEHWARGIELLRKIVPETGTDDDPVPFRELVFGIYVHTVTGRVSTTRR